MSTMSPAEVAAVRHMMGLSLDAFARMLSVHPRTVRSWESGRDLLSQSATEAVRALVRQHDELVEAYLAAGVPIGIARSMETDATPPRGWYLAAAGRALAEEPDTMVAWL